MALVAGPIIFVFGSPRISWLPNLCMPVFFRTLVRTFLFSNLFIAACAGGLVWQTYLLLHQPPQIWLALLAFFATLFIYNLDSLLPYKFNQRIQLSERKLWVRQHRGFLLVLSGIAALAAAGLFLWFAPVYHAWFIAQLVIISLVYSLRIIPRPGGGYLPLRNIPLVKVFLIAYVWSCVTVLLPLLSSGISIFSETGGILFLQRFCFLFALTLLFDIRDWEKDKMTGTLTFPGWVGIRNTKILSLGLLGIFSILTWQTESGFARLALLLSAVAAGAVVIFAHEKRNDYYFLIFADGMMLLQFLLVFLLV